ncbi:lipin Ned1 [Schizosaccharomyces japonicus yFS275]|uniref:Lipin Ned1 n=1 Tax=Schizosaccharomyces japonicus (strain yFS275 / FY16936) TaxID=402676 RepID=B6K141_SCHJY|nr:lipin Ned1 [Schizosaccharomyces japonicus yFS275]EEB07662.1 lipin Ned1 [Schizosaccharomyces japonicus yFS275]
MQYVGRAFGSVSKTWNSINPATLTGAIDVIVVEQQDGSLACSPFHVRFGKFSLLRPSDKKVEFRVNNELTDFNMKLGDGGEAFFVFATENDVPQELQTSPLGSPSHSPSGSPKIQRPRSASNAATEGPMSQNWLRHARYSSDPGSCEPSTPTKSGSGSTTPTHEKRVMPKPELLQKAIELGKRLSGKELPAHVTDNGDIVMDMTGYKASELNRNIADFARETFKDEFPEIEKLIAEDEKGNLWFYASEEAKKSASPGITSSPITSTLPVATDDESESPNVSAPASPKSDSALMREDHLERMQSIREELTRSPSPSKQSYYYVKTLRLTSEQLSSLKLRPGKNDMSFTVNNGKSVCLANLYFWRYEDPVVISDIDGTITKSDALGHMFTFIGKDWTHPGVAKLYSDIVSNGYKIMYLTSRSIGQADSTRHYLWNIEQDGYTMPHGPVILSPDRTIAALHREVILRKPEIFKMACLRDLCGLFDVPPPKSPFYAGFGNRITDAISYNHVGVPPTRIFTINSAGEVHMELLQRSGYRSSYIYMNDLVDYFFPPVEVSVEPEVNTFTDVTYWRTPLPELSDDEDEPKSKKNTPKSQTKTSKKQGSPKPEQDLASNNDLEKEEDSENDMSAILARAMDLRDPEDNEMNDEAT